MLLAVMDLGSNSFKMTIAQWAPELSKSRPFKILHKERHPIQLGRSVFDTGRLSEENQKEALKALSKMKARIRDFSSPILRVVATSAIREARNGKEFVQRVREELGLPLEVISGIEEARLISKGLEWEYPRVARGLLIDIGGGSTELATFGRAHTNPLSVSLKMGSIRLSTVLKKDSKNQGVDVQKSRQLVRSLLKGHPPTNIQKLIGSAGAIQSLGKIFNGRHEVPSIKKSALDAWIDSHSKTSIKELVRHYKLTPSRARIVVPGAIILSEVMEWLNFKEISVTEMTLRDGLLVDLVTRWREKKNLTGDSRSSALPRDPKSGRLLGPGDDRSFLQDLELLVQRFHGDLSHARYVAAHCVSIFDQMKAQGARFSADERRRLIAAAYLHDIGKIVSEAGHQRHSAYLIRHLHLPTFSPLDIKQTALVALFHRKEVPAKKVLPFGISGLAAQQVRRMTAILRLVDGLDEDRTQNISSIVLKVTKGQMLLELIQTHSVPINMDYFRNKSSYFEECFDLKIVSYVHPQRLTRIVVQ